MDLNSTRIFVHVVQNGSFSGASAQLNVPIATVSRRVSELEKSLNVRLLERSTRRLRLTEAGATLFDYALRGLQEMDAGLLALHDQEDQLKGCLRLSLPPHFKPAWGMISKFQMEHPNIDVDIYVTKRKVDFIEDGIDVALRVGDVEQLSVIARHLLSYRHKLVASPTYIKMHGQPSTPQDLPNFQCAAWGDKGSDITWSLGEERISVQPMIRSDEYPFLQFLVIADRCITELPDIFVNDLIAQEKLVEILPNFSFPSQELNLLYPSRKQLSRISRVFIDFCLAHVHKVWPQ